QPRKLSLDAVDRVDDIGARLFEGDEKDAALAIGPGGLLHVLGACNGLADVPNPQGRAIAVCNDDVVPVFRVAQLVVAVDRVGAALSVGSALRANGRASGGLGAVVFK